MEKTEFQTLAQYADENPLKGAFVRELINTLNERDNLTVRNSVAPFYSVEAGDLLWGYNENPLLAALAKLLPGIPTIFGLQVRTTIHGAG